MSAYPPYVFPSHFYVTDLARIIKEEFLNRENQPCIVDTRAFEIYLVTPVIRDFLLFFREPHKMDEYKSNFSPDEVLDFGFFAASHRFLIPDGFSGPPLPPPAKELFAGQSREKDNRYTVIKSLRDNDKVNVDLVADAQGKKFIIKYVVDSENERRRISFRQEFETFRKLGEHPLLCQVIECDEERQRAVLEYIEGDDLRKTIEIRKPALEQKLLLARQIIDAFAFLHENRVIHGDVHPGQFMVREDYSLKVIDFGAAYQLGPDGGEDEFEIIRAAIMKYCAPEDISVNCFRQMESYIPNYESEIYRLGALLYHLFYDRLPLEGLTWGEFYRNVQSCRPEFPPLTPRNEEIPPCYIQVMEKCLRKNAPERFASCVQIQRFLAAESGYCDAVI